ncbi:MAG: 4Fe-4S dicluster domain-containing protein [Candidatus Omnitrophica bacterium]|nr:4Fe-4S dicluster domain-containing protein [Candidatus Omnitrophota bacterium]
MKGIICYYSSTGNTKLACQFIAKNIASIEWDFFDIRCGEIPDFSSYCIVGLATFCDALGVSQLVCDFINTFSSQNNKPCFVFNTYGSISGKTLKILEKLSSEKDFRVVAGHSLHTPDNYPPMIAVKLGFKNSPNTKEMNKFRSFIVELGSIVGQLLNNEPVRERRIKLSLLCKMLPLPARKFTKKMMGQKYVDCAICTNCGICAKVCPYHAIEFNDFPEFNESKCFGCWACYNRCPAKAIYTKKYKGVGNYSHPIDEFKRKFPI